MPTSGMDYKIETQIAVVEILIEGKVVYSKSVYVDDVDGLIEDVNYQVSDYDEAV